MIDAARIRERIAFLGLSQSELARRVGISQGAIAKIANRETSGGSAHLHKIARELGTSAAYLTGETDDPAPDAPLPVPVEKMAEQLDIVMIPEVDLEYGMGGGTVLIDDPDSKPTPFPRAWLEAITYRTRTPVEMLAFARGRGDSMTPTILDGDIVLIDRSQRILREQDRIWACAWGDLGAIKRVRRSAGGGFLLMSDNPVVRDEHLADDELHVVGRVIWIGRTV